MTVGKLKIGILEMLTLGNENEILKTGTVKQYTSEKEQFQKGTKWKTTILKRKYPTKDNSEQNKKENDHFEQEKWTRTLLKRNNLKKDNSEKVNSDKYVYLYIILYDILYILSNIYDI